LQNSPQFIIRISIRPDPGATGQLDTDGPMTDTDYLTPIAMTIADVTRRTGIGRTSIFEAIRHGRLRAIKAGSRTLVKAEDLAAFLDGLPDARAGKAV
jgi:excisionase family DNA binding protein